jgi:uncharacterized protein DUF1203
MAFRFTGLPVGDFQKFAGRSERELTGQGFRRMKADSKPGFPCRVTLEDAEPGESVLLLSYPHLAVGSPYDATGPIFVRENARESFNRADSVPPVLRGRFLSLRAYGQDGMMIDADTIDGGQVEDLLERLFSQDAVAFVHVHNARRGCYSCRVERG